MNKGAIGLRAKTGRAIAVVLAVGVETPAFVWRGELSLVDPEIPATAEPYHEVMELPWSEATIAVQPLVTAIEAASAMIVRNLVEEMRARDVEIRAVGIVGSPPKKLERIGNEHIRAHAAEGVLFRRVLEVAAQENRLPFRAFSEPELKESAEPMSAAIKQMGRTAGSPWRADALLAASAAWLALLG